MFFSVIFQILSGSRQISSGYSVSTWTLLATDLSLLPHTPLWHMHFTEKWRTYVSCRSHSKRPSFCTATIGSSLTSVWMTWTDWSFLVILIKLMGHTCFAEVELYIPSCLSNNIQTACDKISDQNSCCTNMFKFTVVAPWLYGDTVLNFLQPYSHKHCSACTRLCTNSWLSVSQFMLIFSDVPRNFVRGAVNKFSWGQRTERMGIWGAVAP